MVFQSRRPLSQSEYEAVKLHHDTKKTAERKTAELASDPEQPECQALNRAIDIASSYYIESNDATAGHGRPIYPGQSLMGN